MSEENSGIPRWLRITFKILIITLVVIVVAVGLFLGTCLLILRS
jgi:hypothetical protein